MDKVMSPEFRVSFPAVFKPRAFEGQEPKFSVTMLIPKSEDITPLKQLAQKAINEKWPNPAERPTGLRHPFRDGDKEKADVQGYAGHWFIKATSKQKPGVVDMQVNPIIDENEFYAGCYAKATLTAYAYDRAGNRGVAFGLQNVQKQRDGQPFSGRSKPEDDFGVVEVSGSDFDNTTTVAQPEGDMFT